MTRQKKELWKKLDQIDANEEADASFGYWAPWMSEPFDAARTLLLEQLALLCHYSSVDAMFNDSRYHDAVFCERDFAEMYGGSCLQDFV